MKKEIKLVIMSLVLIILLFACKKATITENGIANAGGNVIRNGQLGFAGTSEENLNDISHETYSNRFPTDKEVVNHIFFDDLVSMLSALSSNKVDKVLLPSITADYLVSKNNSYAISKYSKGEALVPFCMLLKKGNEKLRDRLNNAMISIERELIKNIDDIDKIGKVEFTKFDNAETIRFAVTGDIPPIDYVSETGEPIGFNVKLISELCKEMGVNAEIIQINSGARAMALANDKVDVVFWTKGQLEDAYIDFAKNILQHYETEAETNRGNKKTVAGIYALFNEDGTVNEKRIKDNNEINSLDIPTNTICTIPYFCDVMVDVVNANSEK